jgi:HAD superfamily hydrolase (TIGR01509 family)
MNIIIPLGGRGERFSKEGYLDPKPLIQIFEKKMIEYVIDNLTFSSDDKIFIIYNKKLNLSKFSNLINDKYPFIQLIEIGDTKGAVETLYLGLNIILNTMIYHQKSLIIDCDTFYTEDIINIFRHSETNMIFYTKNYDKEEIYSYIDLDNKNIIKEIKEKIKISDNANTGAYGFNDIHLFYNYCKIILDNNITFNNEPYTSCVISEMIKSNIIFKGYELSKEYVFSLGTPKDLENYINKTFAFLFDLDGTLVITEEIYYEVWTKILKKYNIVLNNEIFNKFIQGNNDKYVLNSLLVNINITLDELSSLKDTLFIENINKIKIIDGVYEIIKQIKLNSYKICIVTNCNKIVAKEIIKKIKIDHLIDFIISSEDCINGKPNNEPYKKAIDKYNINNNKCFIFEDSKSGLISGKGVNPNVLIGIETIYNKEEIFNYGCDFSIKNYLNFDINNLFFNTELKYNKIIKLIKYNSNIINIKKIDIDSNKLKGGFIADVISFKIINNINEIIPMVLKLENESNNNLSFMANKLNLYEREYYFYTNISTKVNINKPIFYNLVKNENEKTIGLVLENLFDKNFKLNLNLNTQNIDVSLKIIDRMAKLHSNFWNKNLKQIYPGLIDSKNEIFYPFLTNFISEKKDLFISKWFITLNEVQKKKCNEIFLNFENIQLNFSKGNHLTFIHGDIKSPNIFYDVKNDNEPYFIDWQHCAIGKGVQDLVFFIIESFDINNLKIVFELAKNYYYIKILGYGINNYSFEEYTNDIYDALCYIPFFTSVWFGTLSQDELIDKNFPYLLISKMFYLIEMIDNK